MPELPEVESARSLVHRTCAGRRVQLAIVSEDDKVIVGTTPAELTLALQGAKLISMKRKGKVLWMELDTPGPWPVLHFGMTGGISIQGEDSTRYIGLKEDGSEDWPPRFTKMELHFEGGVRLAFTDPRRFARMWLVQDPETQAPLNKLGPDSLYQLPDQSAFIAMIRKLRGSPKIKAILLDQEFLCGLGNWVVDEVLYQARVHPEQPCPLMDDSSLGAVHSKIQSVIKFSVSVDADSDRYPRTGPGAWLFHSRWTGKKASTINGLDLDFVKVGSRTSAYVPAVQKLVGVTETGEGGSSAGAAKNSVKKPAAKKPAARKKKSSKEEEGESEDDSADDDKDSDDDEVVEVAGPSSTTAATKGKAKAPRERAVKAIKTEAAPEATAKAEDAAVVVKPTAPRKRPIKAVKTEPTSDAAAAAAAAAPETAAKPPAPRKRAKAAAAAPTLTDAAAGNVKPAVATAAAAKRGKAAAAADKADAAEGASVKALVARKRAKKGDAPTIGGEAEAAGVKTEVVEADTKIEDVEVESGGVAVVVGVAAVKKRAPRGKKFVAVAAVVSEVKVETAPTKEGAAVEIVDIAGPSARGDLPPAAASDTAEGNKTAAAAAAQPSIDATSAPVIDSSAVPACIAGSSVEAAADASSAGIPAVDGDSSAAVPLADTSAHVSKDASSAGAPEGDSSAALHVDDSSAGPSTQAVAAATTAAAAMPVTTGRKGKAGAAAAAAPKTKRGATVTEVVVAVTADVDGMVMAEDGVCGGGSEDGDVAVGAVAKKGKHE